MQVSQPRENDLFNAREVGVQLKSECSEERHASGSVVQFELRVNNKLRSRRLAATLESRVNN